MTMMPRNYTLKIHNIVEGQKFVASGHETEPLTALKDAFLENGQWIVEAETEMGFEKIFVCRANDLAFSPTFYAETLSPNIKSS